MKYNFDMVYDRRNTNSLKFDCAAERGVPTDVLPFWVADMDFPAPVEVIDALRKKVEHGIFGYSEPKDEYFRTLEQWFLARHGWKTEGRKFVLSCGVIFSICTLIRILTKPGDAVLICQPGYYPFERSIRENGRRPVIHELYNRDGYYTVDFDDFERKIVENEVKAFILCNPHNPVGRVWGRDELERMGDICVRHGVLVISDEIHSDFTWGAHQHTVFSTVKKEFEPISIICTAPTKTFNLAGLHIANTYIYDDTLRRKFTAELDRQGYSQSNVMGFTACQAAYAYGAEWLDELKGYLAGNIAFAERYIREHMPDITLRPPEGTYLLWLDFRKFGLTDGELRSRMLHDAKLWLDDGYIFGAGGSGFERINIACRRGFLEEALTRIEKAFCGDRP